MRTRTQSQSMLHVCGSIIAIAAMTGMTATQANGAQNIEQTQVAAFDQMRIIGSEEHPRLIVPMELPAWAANLGITGIEREYKGLCGPNGAAITIQDLIDVATNDVQGIAQHQRGATTTELVGDSPTFAITYTTADVLFSSLYLPTIRRAAEYIGNTFDNRVQIDASMALGTFSDPDTIGSAGSVRYTIPWDVYVEGLRSQAIREDSRFADALHDDSVNVLYNGSTSPTTEAQVVVTDAQLRAIFGDSVVPHTQSVSITLNTGSNWFFLDCGVGISSSQSSLVDVCVHEFTHSMGFTSSIAQGGNNSSNMISGLDVARFRAVNFPATNALFASSPRLGEQFTGELHFYSSFPTGMSTLLEEGDAHQPSHLRFIQDPDGKLGVMDPVIVSGTTNCPSFYSDDDILPLDDMGWRPVGVNGLQDCNGNGVPDIIDIEVSGVSMDNDNDRIPDECETFYNADGDPGTQVGVTRTIYNAPGLTDLSFFDPNGSSVTIESKMVIPSMDDTVNFQNAGTRVYQYDFSMFIPVRDEYSFRMEHPDDMFLLIDGLVFGQSERAGSLERENSSTELSSQIFAQLQPGWHTVFVQTMSDDSSTHVQLIRESLSLGGWQDIPQNNLKILNLTDCDFNGQDDAIDLQNDLGFVIDLGVVSTAGASTVFDTFGSTFDTEIAIWDDTGTLVATNDDAPSGGRQSQITQALSAGQYTIAVNGYNSLYSNGPDLEFLGDCSETGSYALSVNDAEIITGTIPSGRVHLFTFSIGDAADCDDDGTPDSEELDCNSNGIPDDCEIPTIADSIDVGVIGDSVQPVVLSTCGSVFDTEIAIWDAAGDLIDFNDDFCDFQSELTLTLVPGEYFAAVTGYNAFFGNDFAIQTNLDDCSEGGDLLLQIGDYATSSALGFGQAMMYRFEVIEGVQCNRADVNMDGLLDFFDISEFLTAYSTGNPIADFNNDGLLDFFDISEFLLLYSNGC